MESGDKYKSVTTVELHHDQPNSNAVKVRIPVKEYPSVSKKFSKFHIKYHCNPQFWDVKA